MNLFRRLPVKAKLTVAILGTTGVSLIVACGLFVIYEIRTFERLLEGRVTVLADVLALSSKAVLDFPDPERAEQILGGVAAEPSILAASLYTMSGEPIATYSRTGTTARMPDRHGTEGARFESGRLFLYRPVMRDNEQIGTIGLLASSEELNARIRTYLMLSFFALAGSLGSALALGYVLQKMIANPILNLAKTAKSVSEQKDYGVRAAKETEDELGRLADSFNEMLSGIQQRDNTLMETNKVLRFEVDARLEAERGLKTLNDELETRVKERTTDLERSNKELEQFAYVASHDLQEPLRMVVSYLQLIERRFKDKFDSDGLQFLKFAVDGGQRMQALILDLLEFSRVGTRRKPFETVDLNKVIQDVRANLKMAILETGATISVDSLPAVRGDFTQLEQLLQNLVSNGIKFRGKYAPVIQVSAERGEREWRISVRDNGIGIEKQYFGRIFIIFQRLHTREDYAGTGIGLAVCKKIVERHGGRIWVESEPGKGSVFTFTIADFVRDAN